MTTQSSQLIDLDDMRNDVRFSHLTGQYVAPNGRNISVVVIDSGIDRDHPAFGNRIAYQYDFSSTNDSDASDVNGHGSNVASIIGSQSGSYLGMAPGVSLIVLKVIGDDGRFFGSDVQEALSWVAVNAAAYNVVSVNMSLGYQFYDPFRNNYFGYNDNTSNSHAEFGISDEIATIAGQGIAVVSSAGNDYYYHNGFSGAQGSGYPGSDPNSWSVGAVWDSNIGSVGFTSGAIDYTTGADRIISFSQRSTSTVDIFAPGGAITGADWNGSTTTKYGTSQAAPHISGVVALAQQLSMEITEGQKLAPNVLLSLMRNSARWIYDGDDENDNVVNTNQWYPRVDVDGLMNAIYNYYNVTTSIGDLLRGANGQDVLAGGGGEDRLYGHGGADFLYGNEHDDYLNGGTGQDYLDGGTGSDTADYSVNTANGTINLGLGTASFVGFGYTESLVSIENVLLGSGIDTIYLPTGNINNLVNGASGTDTIHVTYAYNSGGYSVYGSAANFTMTGSAGTDTFQNIEFVVFTNGVQVSTNNLVAPPPAPPTISIAAANAVQTEGNSGSKAFTFTVNRSGTDLSGSSTVNWSIAHNTTNASDFVGATSGQVSFAAFDPSETITVFVAGDLTYENGGADELFAINLSGATNANIVTSSAQGGIQNDDAVPRADLDAINLSLSSSSVLAGGSVTVSYTIANVGTTPAAASTVGIYRSADGVFDASDTLLTTRPIGPVEIGAPVNDSFAWSLSTLGTYNIIVVADYNNVITNEISESNNPSNAVQVTVSNSQTVNYPDGTRTVQYWDVPDQNPWTDFVWFYDAQGRTARQTVNYDNGTHTDQVWDVQRNNTWTDYVWSYDSQWGRTSQHVNYDDGVHTVQTWDVQGQHAWSNHVVYYDTQFRWLSQQVNYENGTFTAQYWDVQGQQPYVNFVYEFDNQSRLTTQTVEFDDHTHRVQHWDPADNQSWSTYVTYYDASWNPKSQTGYNDNGTTWNIQYAPPVVLDLDGNGLDIIPLYASTASFDMNGGGQRLPTAWIGGDDGLLALDLGADGQAGADGVIDQAQEIAFSLWAPGTTSDLEALRFVFDTNRDGRLDAADARWNEFRVWTDSNSDGVSAASEVKTLVELGIVAVDLDPSTGSSVFTDGTTIQGLSSFTRSDGSTGVVGDLIFAYGTDPSTAMPDIASGSDVVAEVPALSTLLPPDFHLV